MLNKLVHKAEVQTPMKTSNGQHAQPNLSHNPHLNGKNYHSTSLPIIYTSSPARPAHYPYPPTPHESSSKTYHSEPNSHTTIPPPQKKFKSLPKLQLTDFVILRTLGTGSFGRVRLVQYKATGQYYAMKILKKSEVVRLKQVEHVNNERSILSLCDHPFLVKLFGTFQDNANLYVIMEYVVGGEVFSYLKRFQRFPSYIAKFYAAEVVLAIEYLHSKEIIYRDLKPENLLLTSTGHIKITDFGFAKVVPDVTWTLCGTPDYLAPEIIQSKAYGKAVDWYSLGVLIFEMLAGYPPFFEPDHFKLYEKILLGKISWPNQFDPLAKDLIKRLLTPDLSKRFGNLKGGSMDIKRHKWFAEIHWDHLARLAVQPPILPHVVGDGDSSNYDHYPESKSDFLHLADDPYEHLFEDF